MEPCSCLHPNTVSAPLMPRIQPCSSLRGPQGPCPFLPLHLRSGSPVGVGAFNPFRIPTLYTCWLRAPLRTLLRHLLLWEAFLDSTLVSRSGALCTTLGGHLPGGTLSSFLCLFADQCDIKTRYLLEDGLGGGGKRGMLGCCQVGESARNSSIRLCDPSEDQLLVAVRSFTGRKCPGFGPQRVKTLRGS